MAISKKQKSSLKVSRSRKENLARLKLKKATFFCFGLSLFFLPGQNYYLRLQTLSQPSLVRSVESNPIRPADYPVNFSGVSVPNLTATSVLVMDRDSAVVLYQKNANEKLLPASTVKIMTALVSLEHYLPDQIVTIGKIEIEGQKIDLVEGERISVRSLLNGLLVASANDAAVALAQNYPGGQQEFVKMMNFKARDLKLNNTYFANPVGLDTDENDLLLPHHSFTTTLDLARLTNQALRNPLFAQIVSTPQIVITDASGEIVHPLNNINQLLGQIEGIKGVKTGWTKEAGECLVSYVERNDRGVIFVILGSSDRFGETARLIDWVFSNFRWEKVTLPAI